MLILKMPIVETDRLILRPVKASDADDMFEYASDDETVRFLTFPIPESVQDSLSTINNFFLPRIERGIPDGYAIELKENNKMIGTCDIHTVTQGDCGEIGFVLNKAYWGKGLVTEALLKMIEVSFNHCGFRRLELMHDVRNAQSERVIQKADFRYEGLLRQKVRYRDGTCGDMKLYSIIKEEFDKGELKWQKS